MPYSLPPIIWHQMESAGNSTLGANPTWNGTPGFSPCEFGNGAVLDTADKYAAWSAQLPTQKGAVSFFINPNYISTSLTQIEWIRTPYAPQTTQWDFHMYAGTMYLDLYMDPGAENIRYICIPVYSAGTIIHIGITWDASRSAGDRIHAFLNNSPLSMTASYEVAWTKNVSADFYTCLPGNFPFGGILDNLKIYDYFKNDFTWDYGNEGIEPAPAPASNNFYIINS